MSKSQKFVWAALLSAAAILPLTHLRAAENLELQSYLQRCHPAPDPEFVQAADRFINRAKTAGWWPQMSGIYFFCAPTQQAALINVKGTDLSLKVEGQVTFTPHTGVQGDGSTGTLETGVLPKDLPGFELESHSLFVFSQTDRPSLAGDVGCQGGGANLGVRVRNAVLASIWSGTRIPVNHQVKSGRGLTGFVRTGADGGFIVKDAESFDFLQKANLLPTSAIHFLSSGGSYFSANQLAFGFIGSGKLTKAQCADVHAACVEMLNAFGKLADDSDVEVVAPPNAFARDKIREVTPKGLEVYRLAPMPPNDATDFVTNYPYGPLNNAIGRPWEYRSSKDTQIGRWELIWSDRALGPREGEQTSPSKKGNDTMGVVRNTRQQQCRTEFNSYRRAIGSTLIKTAYSAGLKFRRDPDHPDKKGWGDIAEEWGYDVKPWQVRWEKNPNDPIFSQNLSEDTGEIVHRAFCADAKNVDAFFSHDAVDGVYKTARDHVLLGPGRMADVPMARGFVIDHEQADDRPPELEMQFIAEMAKIAHCKKLLLGASGHAVNGGTGHAAGWRLENANALLNLFDWYTVIAASATPKEGQLAALTAQYDFFKGPDGKLPVPASKLCVQMQIGGAGQEVSVEDARILHRFMVDKGILRAIPSNAYGQPGGSMQRKYNQAIAAFLGLTADPSRPVPKVPVSR